MRVILITGANRGIGLAISRSISHQDPKTILYCCSRQGVDLSSELSNQSQAVFPVLDIADPDSIKTLADRVRHDHGHIDVLINNAGVNVDKGGFTPKSIATTMQTNYHGTKNMCEAFLPMMRKGGRIVNIASVAGHLNGYSKSVAGKFRDAAKSTKAVSSLANEFETAARTNEESGYKQSAYCISKAFVVALTKALASENPGILINTCCPGWVDTGMGQIMGRPPKTLEDGAVIPVRLAIGDVGTSSGEFWENDSISSSASGKISPW